MATPQYEFSEQENSQIRDLASKMSFVGFFSAGFGFLALLICLLCALFIYRDRLPAGFRDKAADYLKKVEAKLDDSELKKQASEYSLDKIPTDNNFLTGVAVFTGLTGMIFLLQGVRTRASAASFHQIVDTKGNDITNLMNALGSLQAMYGQVYFLLMVGLLGGLVAIGVTLYHYFGR